VPESGIYVVSVANDVKRTGGAFSVADTGPHRLPSTSGGYLRPLRAGLVPLDRPYEGPDRVGLPAFKVGASLDLRSLWRLVATHTASDVAAATGFAPPAAAAGAGEAAGAPPASTDAPASTAAPPAANTGGEGVLPRLGGAAALRHLRLFPPTHAELRAQMRLAGLPDGLVAAGADLDGALVTKTEAQRREERRRGRIRKPHKASLRMDLAPAMANTAAGRAAQLARMQIAVERHVKDLQAAAAARAAGESVAALRRF